MPYAQPPLGPLRFAPPQAPKHFYGVHQATSYGAACPQQPSPLPDVLPFPLDVSLSVLTNISENCLFINVIRPKVISGGQKLPILLWFYGGGFETGDSSQNPGDSLVMRSIALNQPVIHVSVNYRLNAFGFLGGTQVQKDGIGNAGLRDQRYAMQWVQSYISHFGGDANQVTIWGESAGALAVGLHLVINNGNPQGLFRAAVMESGGPYTLHDISEGQQYYDHLVSLTGCGNSSDSLNCLRHVPMDALITAVSTTPEVFNFTSLNLAWQPRIDGVIFHRNPQNSVAMGNFAKVPLLAGDCQDEGTIFSLGNVNITTDDEFEQYIRSNYFQGATQAQIQAIAQAYPQDPSQAIYSFPSAQAIFRLLYLTGFSVRPQYKRLASIQGDLIFQAPRRLILKYASKTQNTWAYLYQRGSTTPYLGAFHGSDIGEFYGVPGLADPAGSTPDFIGTDALIFFASQLDPNPPSSLAQNVSYLSQTKWDKWSSSVVSPPLLTFTDPQPSLNITLDNYRVAAMNLITSISQALVP
ncbi:sterol esterase [Mycena sanguinolenta]|nr:sterol esterase [Mycena sanguinolenta]